jgi:hypothetical protein
VPREGQGGEEMTRYLVKWEVNPCMLPIQPEEREKLLSAMFEMERADEAAGICVGWGMYVDMSGGVSFSDMNEVDLQSALMKYYPYIQFEIRPILSLDQAIQAMQNAVASR